MLGERALLHLFSSSLANFLLKMEPKEEGGGAGRRSRNAYLGFYYCILGFTQYGPEFTEYDFGWQTPKQKWE